ncbi:UvrB/UvrC motif-containing protein [Brockia lithotrophica]|uniref:UvrB/UvrC motif-containing protein n=1 Tax=Brockia lithotrophica TaxID=933949 RepID=UPI003EC07285
MEQEMREAAEHLDFERAAEIRDLLIELKGDRAWLKKRRSGARHGGTSSPSAERASTT